MRKNLLAVHEFPCTNHKPKIDALVLLHGWGVDSKSWQPLIPHLQKIANLVAIDLPGFGESAALDFFALDNVVDLIASYLPTQSILVGWSLGGMLAVQLSVRYPKKISGLVTLAANSKFVAGEGYDAAMLPSVNHQFNEAFATNPTATLKMFIGLLAQGDSNDRALLKKLRCLAEPEKINKNWWQALQLLSAIDNRAAFSAITQPGIHVLAEQDVLVPVSAAQSLGKINTNQKIMVIPGAAHALHWSQPELVANAISEFLLADSAKNTDSKIVSPSPIINKQKVAQSFSRAAHTYDAVADLQREVGNRLLQKIAMKNSAGFVLDLGCGTGHFSEALQQTFPGSNVIGLDIAEGMLRFSRNRHPGFSWLCGDAEYLPLADSSLDFIFSSLALQWCENLPQLFAELHRVLKPGGQLVFSSLGPKTLHELKSAWQQVDSYVHVNRFQEQQNLEEGLVQNGFKLVDFSRSESVLNFASLADLVRSLKALGAHNMNPGQAQGLAGRKKMEAFRQAYEKFRRHGLLPATYDVYYVHAQKVTG